MNGRILGGALLLALVAGCNDNPPLGPSADDELTVELAVEPGHAHILSPVTFTATVRDGHGNVVTAFDTLRVERRTAAGDTWRTAVNLERMGTSFTGAYTFASSGEYELRVMGQRSGHGMGMEMVPMAHMMEPLSVGRAHIVVGDVRVEFESFPGHIHDGDEITVKFWTMESEKNAADERPPLTGLSGLIVCTDAGGATEQHTATESEAGVYEAMHLFQGAGDALAEIRLTTAGGEVTASFPLHVASLH